MLQIGYILQILIYKLIHVNSVLEFEIAIVFASPSPYTMVIVGLDDCVVYNHRIFNIFCTINNPDMSISILVSTPDLQAVYILMSPEYTYSAVVTTTV